ncbi:DNA polymerase III subunit tau [Oxobacter pfennigii]|uniref:DNA polymerase III subunit delta' n=1 Tax=Oxobacter pfennigii TaxID=36849 RepID=A0A0P8WL12_9CLOT|nr:DNA polymerase III subunit delta' [Oxobacter pfennigii]KPU43061.1 DNA polymerase III subunit tau [Oxobacter pfennigii]
MVFEDIAGQHSAVLSLKNSIEKGRIAHAYLFSGPDGVGKSIAASIFANTLNCREKGVNPCGHCPSCIKAQDKNHPDIIHVKKLGGSISINDIRELQANIQKKPYEKGIKVFIIYEADKMTEEAQNALLKTLEEPPGHAVIILLAEKQHTLLTTIASRCQIFKFSRASQRDVELFLKKQCVDEKEIRYIAALSNGIIGRALEIIQDNRGKKDRDEIIEIIRKLFKNDTFYVLSKVDYFLNNKDNIEYILDVMISWYRDILIYKETKDESFLINLDKEDIIIDESSKLTSANINKIINSIKDTLKNIKANANFQLSIETMLLNIQEG